MVKPELTKRLLNMLNDKGIHQVSLSYGLLLKFSISPNRAEKWHMADQPSCEYIKALQEIRTLSVSKLFIEKQATQF